MVLIPLYSDMSILRQSRGSLFNLCVRQNPYGPRSRDTPRQRRGTRRRESETDGPAGDENGARARAAKEPRRDKNTPERGTAPSIDKAPTLKSTYTTMYNFAQCRGILCWVFGNWRLLCSPKLTGSATTMRTVARVGAAPHATSPATGGDGSRHDPLAGHVRFDMTR